MINESRLKGDLISYLFLIYDYLKIFELDSSILRDFRIVIGEIAIVFNDCEFEEND